MAPGRPKHSCPILSHLHPSIYPWSISIRTAACPCETSRLFHISSHYTIHIRLTESIKASGELCCLPSVPLLLLSLLLCSGMEPEEQLIRNFVLVLLCFAFLSINSSRSVLLTTHRRQHCSVRTTTVHLSLYVRQSSTSSASSCTRSPEPSSLIFIFKCSC